MHDQNNKSEDNIIDLASERKRQKTLRKKRVNGATKGDEKQGPSRIMLYIQFALFVGFFAYLLQQCGR